MKLSPNRGQHGRVVNYKTKIQLPNMIEDGRNTETRGCVISFGRWLGRGCLGLGWDGVGG